MFILHHRYGLINIGVCSGINREYDTKRDLVCRLYYPDNTWRDIEEYYWDVIMEKLKL